MAARKLSDEVSVTRNSAGSEERPCRIGGASLDGFPDAFVELDRGDRITSWNSQAEAVFGWPRGEAIGHTLSQLVVSPSHREDYDRALRYFFGSEANTPPRRMEITGFSRDAREIPLEL